MGLNESSGLFLTGSQQWISRELFWSGKRDSNPRPLAWEANALPTELLPLLGAKNLSLI